MAMVTWGPPLPRDQTDTTENITFPQPSLASSNKDWLKFKYGITRQFSILICKSVTRLIVITWLGTALGEKKMEAQNRFLIMTKMTNSYNFWICFSYRKDILSFALPTFISTSKKTKIYGCYYSAIILLLGALSQNQFWAHFFLVQFCNMWKPKVPTKPGQPINAQAEIPYDPQIILFSEATTQEQSSNTTTMTSTSGSQKTRTRKQYLWVMELF